MTERKLSAELQTFVVQSLACFDSPTEIAAVLKQDQSIEITPQGIESYDPTKKAGARLSNKWTELFNATRETFLKDTALVGISHRAVRLRALNRMAQRAEQSGDMSMTAQLLEQAAKEVGDAYTNRRQLTGPNNGPIQTETRDSREALNEALSKMSDADRESLRGILERSLAREAEESAGRARGRG